MDIFDTLTSYGVTRLCHFTKLQGLTHILASEIGVLSSNSIRSDIKTVTDSQRYDGELDYICCSIEYPNSWFLKQASKRNSDKVFQEWVVIYSKLEILNHRNIKICPCNAGKCRGKFILEDASLINKLYASKTCLERQRPSKMLQCCPTDGQAEVLIRDSIPRNYITGIAVGNTDIAERIFAILKIYGISNISIYIAPDVLSTNWNDIVRDGKRPEEILYFHGGGN